MTRILRYFGLERYVARKLFYFHFLFVSLNSSLDNSNAVRILRLLFPDIIIFATATICFVIIRRTLIQSKRRQENDLQTSTVSNTSTTSPTSNSTSSSTSQARIWPRIRSVIRRTRLFFQFLLIGFAAFIYPSIINSIYFVFFFLIALTWSFSIKFGRKFAFLRALLVIYAGVHLLTYYLYQFTFFQDIFPPLSLWSKYEI